MFAGYVGRNYQAKRGLLLLAINPGGGGDDYERTTEDAMFYSLLSSLKNASAGNVEESFEAVNDAFVPILRSWNLWRILQPTLVATGRTIDEIAYMNVVPYRTRENRMPRVTARRESWRRIVEPSLNVLAPAMTLTLGKKAGSVVKELSETDLPDYCVPRTNGDSYISDEAKVVLRAIRADVNS